MTALPDPIRRQMYVDATGVLLAAVRHSASGDPGPAPAVIAATRDQLADVVGVAAGIIDMLWHAEADAHGVSFDHYLAALGVVNANLG